MNTACDQIYLVLEGSCVVTKKINGEMSTEEIEKGDAMLFEKNIPFAVEGNKVKVVITNSPEWNVEQYKIIDEK